MTRLVKVASWPGGKPRGHVIFVHGLGGHAYDTWRRGADDDTFWPVWLARDIEGLTVWTLDYAAPPTNWLGNALPLQDRAITVLETLLSEPELADTPIAFVCHSLGGLVVKQMLREADGQRERRAEVGALVDQVKAVVFFATPHTGSAHASWLDRLRLIAWPSTATQDLIKNDPNLRNLNVWYRNWPNQIAHRIFYETQGTAAGTLVDPASADAGLLGVVPVPIEADHIHICKPFGEDDPVYLGYVRTRDFLAKEVFEESPRGQRYESLSTSVLPAVTPSRPEYWAPLALRVAVLVFVAVVGFKGVEAIFFPSDPLQDVTVQQIEQVLSLKRPELTPEQIDRFISSLRAARGDATFEKAVEEAAKGNTRVAEGMWRQIYEDRKKQQDNARTEQAEAARNLAATAIVESAADGLSWYREATTLDPQNMEGWLGLGDAAMSAGPLEEAKRAFRRYISLAETAGDEREKAVGYGGLGDVLVAEGNLPKARKAYEDGLDIFKRLAEADPSHAGYQRDLSVSYERLGDVLVAEGNLPKARKAYEDGLDI